jgi:hypothetical protein
LEQYTLTIKPKNANSGMRPEIANGAKAVASTTMRERKDGSLTRFQVYQRAFASHRCQKSLRKITRKSRRLNTIGVTMDTNSPEETPNDITTTNTIITTTSNNNT